MSSGPSLVFSNSANYQPTMKYLMNVSDGSYIMISNFVIKTGIDYSESVKVLEELCQSGFLEKKLALRCPECGLLLDIVKPEKYEIGEQYCANCDEDLDITNDCVEVVFKVINNPFATGQENKTDLPKHSSALNNFSLETFLKNGGSFNRDFYCPTNEDYKVLTKKFNNIFNTHKTTKEHGDSLEDLVLNLFRCCKHFSATNSAKLGTNQIDCLVRNKMYIPGISQVGTNDFFIIECKNENKSPGTTYFNKLHSTLKKSSLQLGIIVSKFCAAKTLNKTAHDIFLSDKIIMISLDSNDLKKIIIERVNLLECLERKIAEVKLDANKDLIELGLFEG